jgi:hypothetical protein
MFSVDLSTREWDSHVVVAPSEELDLVDAEAALAPQQSATPDVPGGWSCHCGGPAGRAGRIASCSQGRHPPERSTVARGSRRERQERPPTTAPQSR